MSMRDWALREFVEGQQLARQLSQRQHRARKLRAAALAVLSGEPQKTLARRQRWQEVKARAEAIVATSREEREAWHRRRRLRRWQYLKSEALQALSR